MFTIGPFAVTRLLGLDGCGAKPIRAAPDSMDTELTSNLTGQALDY
jgi:hypothetical protein